MKSAYPYRGLTQRTMGNTCSSVHIALAGTTPDAIRGIVRAYTTLGFEHAKTQRRRAANM